MCVEEEFWIAPYMALDGSSNQHLIDLHKKLLDLKSEVEKLNRHGGQLVFVSSLKSAFYVRYFICFMGVY